MKIIVSFLLEKCKNGLSLKLNKEFQTYVEENLKLMEDNLDEFNLRKEEVLNHLSETNFALNSFSFNLLYEYGLIDLDLLREINLAFAKILFKSITYKEIEKKPEIIAEIKPENGENKPENSENIPENSENKPQSLENPVLYLKKFF